MKSPKSHDILLLVLILCLAGVGWNLQTQLQQVNLENEQLREMIPKQATCPEVEVGVQVACECLGYEEGYEDGLNTGPSLEELEHLCADLDEYGYVPRC